jgi:hypothetical protein
MDSVLVGSPDLEDYPIMDVRWEGRWQFGHRALIYAASVRIENCDIDTGDDAISLKSGRGMNGARIGKPTEDVLIRRCVLGGGYFACIGSETSGGIRDVRIEKTRFTHSRTYAIYIKIRTGRGGVIENIIGKDLDIADGGFLCINSVSGGNQSTPDDMVQGKLGYPIIRNIRFSDIRLKDVTTLTEAVKIAPEIPILGLSLRNITGTCHKGIFLANIQDASLRNINVTGFTGPLLTIENEVVK